jgi:SAM-dependent methyltransferase
VSKRLDIESISGGVRRSLRLLQSFRTQFDDPDGFYTLLADDTVELVKEHAPVIGQRVVDVGGGPGYFAQAFRRAGARSTFVEPFWESMTTQGRELGYGVIGDGLRLPFGNGSFDISHSSNVLEHVTDPMAFLREMVRIVRPDGLVFLAFTNWYSPFGGMRRLRGTTSGVRRRRNATNDGWVIRPRIAMGSAFFLSISARSSDGLGRSPMSRFSMPFPATTRVGRVP